MSARGSDNEHAGAEAEERESTTEGAGCTVVFNIRGRTDPVLIPLTEKNFTWKVDVLMTVRSSII